MKIYFNKSGPEVNRASNEYLRVNNFGYYKDLTADITTKRPNGRVDYQLIYIESGYVSFYVDEKEVQARSGSVFLYRPGEPQFYSFRQDEDSAYYWIHFSGGEADELLKRLNIGIGVINVGYLLNFHACFSKMRAVASQSTNYNEDAFAGCLIDILCEISKQISQSTLLLDSVISEMQNDVTGHKTISQYAKICGMTEGHFIRSFKHQMGMTPLAYKQKMQIEYARHLLSKSNMNISEISNYLGYDDPLYFSRLFKKKMGISPSEYKKNHQI